MRRRHRTSLYTGKASQFGLFRTQVNLGQLAAYRNMAVVAGVLMLLDMVGVPLNSYRIAALLVVAAALFSWRRVATSKVRITTSGLTAPDAHRNGKPIKVAWEDVRAVSIQTFDFGIAYLARLDGSPDLTSGGVGMLSQRSNMLSEEEDDDPLSRLQYVIVDMGEQDVWIKTDDPAIARSILRTLSWWHAEFGPRT